MPRVRGVPADWDEIKERRSITISPKAWEGLESLVIEHGYKSKSDLIEAIGRGKLKIQKDDEN
jgi:metal-responsive CopG/Arc/MetJ family transcriptional regulator